MYEKIPLEYKFAKVEEGRYAERMGYVFVSQFMYQKMEQLEVLCLACETRRGRPC